MQSCRCLSLFPAGYDSWYSCISCPLCYSLSVPFTLFEGDGTQWGATGDLFGGEGWMEPNAPRNTPSPTPSAWLGHNSWINTKNYNLQYILGRFQKRKVMFSWRTESKVTSPSLCSCLGKKILGVSTILFSFKWPLKRGEHVVPQP